MRNLITAYLFVIGCVFSFYLGALYNFAGLMILFGLSVYILPIGSVILGICFIWALIDIAHAKGRSIPVNWSKIVKRTGWALLAGVPIAILLSIDMMDRAF